MRKVLILTSVLAMLGAGNAFAFDASNGFGPSAENDLPAPRFEVTAPAIQMPEAASIGNASNQVRFSAAEGFGPTQHDDLTAPSFELAAPIDRTVVTAGIRGTSGTSDAVMQKRVAWSAADGFGASAHDGFPTPRFEVAG